MRMIILAAGRGERLMPLTKNTPKPLIDMGNGNTLLEEQVHSIRASGKIGEIVVVIGYLAEQVEAKIQAYSTGDCRIRTIFNPFWQVSNNLMSLWLARHELETDDVMITNGDNLFTPEVFSDFAGQGDGIWLNASPKAEFDADDMKVAIENGAVVRVSKEIPTDQASAESPGLALIKGKRARDLFLAHLDGTVRDLSNINKFWLEVFNHLWRKGIPVNPWLYDVKGKWQEVDFHVDVHRVRLLIHEKMRSFHEGSPT